MSKEEFETEVIRFMARIDEHMKNQNKRCDSHALDIRSVKDRVTSLEDSRTFVKGVAAGLVKLCLAIVGVSGIVYGWVQAFGPHAEKAVK